MSPAIRPSRPRAPLTATILAALTLCAGAPAPARAQVIMDEPPAELRGVEIVERRGERLPLDLVLQDSSGRPVRLGEYFDGKRPVVLILGYYTCPMQCQLVFSKALEAFKGLNWTMGDEYRVLTVSFDHRDTPDRAAGWRGAMLAGYGRETVGEGWSFCCADLATARRLSDAAGFHYNFVREAGEFAHPSAIMILSPHGEVANYMYGTVYPVDQLKLALGEAAEGRVGSVFERFYARCFIYDPNKNSFVADARFIMRLGGGLTVGALAALVGGLIVWNRRHPGSARGGTAHGNAPAPA